LEKLCVQLQWTLDYWLWLALMQLLEFGEPSQNVHIFLMLQGLGVE
jgi:hypothetical protein